MKKNLNLKTDLIDKIFNEEKQKIRDYEKGNGLLQKIADGRLKLTKDLKIPRFSFENIDERAPKKEPK